MLVVEPSVRDGDDVRVSIDADQIEQILINVMRNAVDASIEHAAVSLAAEVRDIV